MTYPQHDPYGSPSGQWVGGPPVQPYGYVVEHPQGTTVLVLGILGIVLCQICGPFAWRMGRSALNEIDADPGRYNNRGAVQAGYICGIVGTVLLGLYLVFGLLYFLLVGVMVIGST